MRKFKFNPRYLYTAAATAAITAAVVAIPAMAASGGTDSTTQGQASANAPAPRSRAELDKFASCLKDHGVDVPAPGSTSRPPQPPSSSEMERIKQDCGTPPGPPPGLPPLSGKQADQARKAMAKGDCPPLPAPPADSGSSGSGNGS